MILRIATEWGRQCYDQNHQDYGPEVLCLACADAYARQRVEEWQAKVRADKLSCGHPSFYMCGQGACGFCHEIKERIEAFRARATQRIEKMSPCRCGTDLARARGETSWIRTDIVCAKHDRKQPDPSPHVIAAAIRKLEP